MARFHPATAKQRIQKRQLAAWQQEIVHQRIVQPCKQVFRELYLLTPAEEETRTYSNHFDGHLVDSRIAALMLFAVGTVVSMAVLSSGFGVMISKGVLVRHLDVFMPMLASGCLIFGVYYLFSAVQSLR